MLKKLNFAGNSRPMDKTLANFKTVVEVVEKLRGPDGCPWDKEQTQKSLTQYIIEEAFELVEAIESGHQQDIQEELGDFLFQVILQSQVAKDEGHFDLSAVLHGLAEKLIHRHPHVFSPDSQHKAGKKEISEIWNDWHKLKAQENLKKGNKTKPIFNYPVELPSLQAAAKIGRKTESYRFDWSKPEEVMIKVEEELEEVRETFDQGTMKEKEHEIGDLLFSVAQLARHLEIDPEAALREANRRFQRRFIKTLELSNKNQDEFAATSIAEKEQLWQQAKKLCPE